MTTTKKPQLENSTPFSSPSLLPTKKKKNSTLRTKKISSTKSKHSPNEIREILGVGKAKDAWEGYAVVGSVRYYYYLQSERYIN